MGRDGAVETLFDEDFVRGGGVDGLGCGGSGRGLVVGGCCGCSWDMEWEVCADLVWICVLLAEMAAGARSRVVRGVNRFAATIGMSAVAWLESRRAGAYAARWNAGAFFEPTSCLADR